MKSALNNILFISLNVFPSTVSEQLHYLLCDNKYSPTCWSQSACCSHLIKKQFGNAMLADWYRQYAFCMSWSRVLALGYMSYFQFTILLQIWLVVEKKIMQRKSCIETGDLQRLHFVSRAQTRRTRKHYLSSGHQFITFSLQKPNAPVLEFIYCSVFQLLLFWISHIACSVSFRIS